MESTLADKVARLATESDMRVVETLQLPGREATYVGVPPTLLPVLREWIEREYPRGLYAHQADAIASAIEGRDVCLATSTASGKTLVFTVVAAQECLEDAGARVLVLYPARALIQDQLDKWRVLLEPLGLRVGRIDGTVDRADRTAILKKSNVVLMTPDVVQAWLMASVAEPDVGRFLGRLRLLVLDELHAYDGVFGTNMAFLIRRLQAVTGAFRLVVSTATLHDPPSFVKELTGRDVRCFGPEDDGARVPPKTMMLLEPEGKAFDALIAFLPSLCRLLGHRFLAFGDSRKMVERLVAAAHRKRGEPANDEDTDDDEASRGCLDPKTAILPYRAGYEVADRDAIQRALQNGGLCGVVSTSALELGIDIGEIDVVVLLGPPPTVSSFWQRVGRAGRSRPGVCVIVDRPDSTSPFRDGLNAYLERPIEPNRLYVRNRYVQYANVLCAAVESQAYGTGYDRAPFDDLPSGFVASLENETTPLAPVAADLYPLKQRAQAGPHLEFPMRNATEPSYQVLDRGNRELGTLSYAQLLREAYPGAIYYYMARPSRVCQVLLRDHKVRVQRCRHGTTSPIKQNKVFPDLLNGVLQRFEGAGGLLAEAKMQVSERVLGFAERVGQTTVEHHYGPGSQYSQRELSRFFETSGVCWKLAGDKGTDLKVAEALRDAFCVLCGVQSGDVGVGTFYTKDVVLGQSPCRGVCIYDATYGSLRLTEQLAARFGEVVALALAIASDGPEPNAGLADVLEAMHRTASSLVALGDPGERTVTEPGTESDWVEVIAPGEKGMYVGNCQTREVRVLGSRYTPMGLVYDLEPEAEGARWTVVAAAVAPLYGSTRMVEVNLVTGEQRPPSPALAPK